MKITISQKDSKKVLDYYLTKLHEKFGGELITMALIYRMQTMLDNLQQHMSIIESHKIWTLPVVVIADMPRQEFDVSFKNPEGIIFV